MILFYTKRTAAWIIVKGERRLGKIRGGKPINEIEHFVINYINYEQERKRSRWVKLNYDVFDVSGIIYIVQSCPDVD